MFEQTFKNIDDKLWKDAGCSSELDYVEQTSWILFLKYLDDQEKLPHLLTLKYQVLEDAKEVLGSVEVIRNIFINFQKYLYQPQASAYQS